MTGFAPKYDLFVFDWDGTVMDTTALIAKGIQHAAREMGYPVPSFQDACGVIGLDWRSAILKVVPDCPESEHMRFGEIYRAWYIPHEADVILFPGMRELIVGLHARASGRRLQRARVVKAFGAYSSVRDWKASS